MVNKKSMWSLNDLECVIHDAQSAMAIAHLVTESMVNTMISMRAHPEAAFKLAEAETNSVIYSLHHAKSVIDDLHEIFMEKMGELRQQPAA